MSKKTIRDIDVKGKRVLVRADFNVPVDADKVITDDKRITAAMPTINYLLDQGAKVILCSHFGRPKGTVDPEFSLAPVAKRLAELYPNNQVVFAKDVIGDSAKAAVAAMKDGEIVLLENVRFHKEETENDPAFAKELASLADVFVLDAFGSAHRAHASTCGVAQYLPCVAGFLMELEINELEGMMENPERPFMAILGGAKVKDKIAVIRNLLTKCDVIILGGVMSHTFVAAQGLEVGNTPSVECFPMALELLEEAKQRGVKILMPTDLVISKEFAPDAEKMTVPVGKVPEGWGGMDIGEDSRDAFVEEIMKAKSIIWNGPMGAYEFKRFLHGTRCVAEACIASGAKVIIGGGDSASAVKKMGIADKFHHICTGGGAALEYMEGKVLPGVAAINDK